jgi:hypothetical protein
LPLGFCWAAVPGKVVTKGGKNIPGIASCLCLLLSCLQVGSVALKSELEIGSVLKDLRNALYSSIDQHLESSYSLLQYTLMLICCKGEVKVNFGIVDLVELLNLLSFEADYQLMGVCFQYQKISLAAFIVQLNFFDCI